MNPLFYFLLLSLFGQLAASSSPTVLDPKEIVSNELARLDFLIEATEKSLQQQQKLRSLLKDYQKLQAQYLNQPDDNELLFQLIKSAYTILETIKTLHLETAFEPEFLSELTVLAKPAIKSGMPRP